MSMVLPYRYRHMPIGGGGYVTGFYFHPADPKVMYCRTDIGGMYRFDYDTQTWVSLIDHITPLDGRECCPISAALDADRPGRLYVASGSRTPGSHGKLTVSDDYGATSRSFELPVFVHGNLHGRSAGERLLAEGDKLWLASQLEGLWFSSDAGESWQKVESFPETGCTFVTKKGDLLLVGTEGLALRTEDMRGPSLYASFDNGVTFTAVSQPEYVHAEGSKLHGLVAQRCAFDEDYLYVTFSANGPRSQNVEKGYTCDCGDCSNGLVVRYPFDGQKLGAPEDITPEKGNWGFSSMSARHGMLITATTHRQHQDGDAIYLSRDQGKTWKTILHGLSKGRMAFRLRYMIPEYNGGNIVHWMTDVQIDPHRPDAAWFNTGTGTFRTQNLRDDVVVWSDWCDGMEETVHINIHAPASGRVQLLDMIGDLGGFAFTDVDKHCENSFANEKGDRWITCLSCDWPDNDPDHIVVAARGNWTGRTLGGLIVTRDGAQTWRRLPTPAGLGEETDALLKKIERPNTNAGWVAVSADGSTYVWAPSERIFLHAKHLIVSHDQGAAFRHSTVLDTDGQPYTGMLKPLADRCMAKVFYGFGDQGELFVSTDGGDTFRQKAAPAGFPVVHFGKVDCADTTEIRVAGGEAGVIYIATGDNHDAGDGLWKLVYAPAADTFTGVRFTMPGDLVYTLGLGLGRPDGDYFAEPKAIYFSGVIDGEYGFYRIRPSSGMEPDDGYVLPMQALAIASQGKRPDILRFGECATIERLNNDQQMYGRIHSIDGDKRVFGRFFLATGSSGLLYGTEIKVQEDN